VQMIIDNLYEYKVLVGVLEEMDNSLKLMKYAMDSNDEMTPLFAKFGMTTGQKQNETEIKPDVVIKNVATVVSTGDVIKEIQQNATFMAEITKYLTYDQILYDHAVNVHKQQVSHFVQTAMQSQ